MAVSKPTPGGGAPLGIDLDTGKATITIRPSSSTADASDDARTHPEKPEHQADQHIGDPDGAAETEDTADASS